MQAAGVRFGGDETFHLPPEALFAVLTDLRAIAERMPDVSHVQALDDHAVRCVVHPRFSFFKGTLKQEMRWVELNPPASGRLQIHAHGIGLEVHCSAELRVTPHANGAQLAWFAAVDQMRGLLTSISPTLVRASAEAVIRDVIGQLRQRLTEPADAAC